MNQERPPVHTEETISNQPIDALSVFDTDGMDEYPKEKFLKYTKENNLDVSSTLDAYLDKISLDNRFSVKEMKYVSAFRAWLHCDFEHAKKYVSNKFEFNCNDNASFVEKYRFFNTVAVFIFDNKNINTATDIVKEEKFIFQALKEKIKEKNGSFLLNYLAADYLSVINKERSSVQDEKHIDWAPYKIAPRVYAFDSRNSALALIHKNKLNQNSLYVSDENDFEKITPIIKSLEKNGSKITQSEFDEILPYFSVLEYSDLTLNKNKQDTGGTEMFLFRELNTKYHREKLKKETGIDIHNLSLVEQKNLIDYLKFVNKNSLEKVIDFNKKYDKNGFRTFLSIEQGGREMGDKILTLGEKLPEEIAKKVFKKYGEIVDTAELAGQTLEKLLPKEIFEASRSQLKEIKESLLIRAKNLLVSYYEKRENHDDKRLLEDLERFKSDILLYADTYKGLINEGIDINIEDFKDTQIISLIDEERETEADELWRVTRTNREKFITDPVIMEKREKRFRETLQDKNIDFQTLKHKGEIMASCSVEKDIDGNYLVESLNVESEIKGSKIGSAFFPAVVKKYLSKGHDVYGYVNSGNKGTLPYYERIGFKVKEVKKDGEIFYEIRIKPNQD
jgi:N-acetylglutamate synthase-like GNAT family acetyltransferase